MTKVYTFYKARYILDCQDMARTLYKESCRTITGMEIALENNLFEDAARLKMEAIQEQRDSADYYQLARYTLGIH